MLYLINILNLVLQAEAVDKMLEKLAEQGPVVTIAILVCIYFYKQIGKKEKEIETLNGYIRESDKENLQILNDVNNTLDKVLENQKHSNEMVIKEIENLKEYISLKLDRD